ncbi:MAG: metallo-beta-lactamase family protein [Oscillospiraceae bacterium]|nr:metallo-beta-lactamase family protein [Oscillospiraceae bacterium]
MIIRALAENTSISEKYGSEHGLSLYIETNKHKLLFDTGRSGLFIENAEKMGIDLSVVDTAFISHGHYDHGGGLSSFLKINQKSAVYIHERAFGEYYSKRPAGPTYIGLDKDLQDNERIVFTKDYLQIDDELSLFSGIQNKELPSHSNKALLMKKKDDFIEDTFVHEQNLIISENGKTVLIAGCAHNGIVNIAERFFEITGQYADVVIGGFHLFN